MFKETPVPILVATSANPAPTAGNMPSSITITVSPNLPVAQESQYRMFGLVIPQSMISAGTGTITLTDAAGTSVPLLTHRGDNLRCDSLIKRNELPENRHGERPLRAYLGIDPNHAMVFDRLPKSAYLPTTPAAPAAAAS
jgi:hypothetical protein